MIFKRKNKYKLPQFPPNATKIFIKLCQNISFEECEKLRSDLNNHFENLSEKAQKNHYLDLKSAKKIYENCIYLLDCYTNFNDYEKTLVIGAIRYFISNEDALDDDVFASGLVDDIQILNYVMQEVKILDRFILEEY